MMKDKLQAFDSIFSDGQIQDIISMSLIAKKSGKVLHEMLNECPPVSKRPNQQTKGSIKKLTLARYGRTSSTNPVTTISLPLCNFFIEAGGLAPTTITFTAETFFFIRGNILS